MKIKIKSTDFNYELKLNGKHVQQTVMIICGTVLITRFIKLYSKNM